MKMMNTLQSSTICNKAVTIIYSFKKAGRLAAALDDQEIPLVAG